MRSVARNGPLPLFVLPIRPVHPPPLRLHLWMLVNRRVRCLLPPLGILALVVVPLGVTARLLAVIALLSLGLRVSVWVCGPRLALPGLVLGSVVSSPTPSGAAEDDHCSTFDSVDLAQDDSFQAVLCLIREFHSMEEPASVAPNRCKTSLSPVYGLQSESSPALHLPLSPLLQSLLEDTNSALAKFVEVQTVHGFLSVPCHRHWQYYRTSSSCFPGPYTVPPGLASIALEKVSELWNHSVSLSHSQVSSLETMLLVFVRSPPGWIGGFPLAGVSGSI